MSEEIACRSGSNKADKLLALAVWLVGGLVAGSVLLWYRSFFPPPNYDTYILSFFGVSVAFGAALFGLGHTVALRVFGIPKSGVEIALGLGSFALFLSFYLKFTLNAFLPLAVLGLGLLVSLKLLWIQRRALPSLLSSPSCAAYCSLLALIILPLSFNTQFDAFLQFPRDADSALIHVTAAKIIVRHGHYFNPDWLRGVWLPQLTLGLYTFLLTILDHGYLKIINVIVLVHFASLFARGIEIDSRNRLSIAALFFSLLVSFSAFRLYVVQTNLDTIFALFAVSAFFTLLRHLRQPTGASLLLMAFLCGLSGGQKHFGLMYSVPVLGGAALTYLVKDLSRDELLRKCGVIVSSGLLFCATFSPFYLHNLLSGANLLFPFFGSGENSYGWNADDLKQMIESTIPYWGHSKSFLGFFQLPSHLLQYSEKYHFRAIHSWVDCGVSIAIVAQFAMVLGAIFFKKLRAPVVLIPVLVLCAQVAFWYRGSQVVRYLFPVLISTVLFFSFLVQSIAVRARLGRWSGMLLVMISYATAFSMAYDWKVRPAYPLARGDDEVLAWVAKYRKLDLGPYQWIQRNVPRDSTILNFSGQELGLYFIDHRFCGDFFGKCRYNEFLAQYVVFRQWHEMREVFIKNDIRYVLMRWDMVSAEARIPQSPQEWDVVMPASTRECLQEVYSDGLNAQIFSVRESCLVK